MSSSTGLTRWTAKWTARRPRHTCRRQRSVSAPISQNATRARNWSSPSLRRRRRRRPPSLRGPRPNAAGAAMAPGPTAARRVSRVRPTRRPITRSTTVFGTRPNFPRSSPPRASPPLVRAFYTTQYERFICILPIKNNFVFYSFYIYTKYKIAAL